MTSSKISTHSAFVRDVFQGNALILYASMFLLVRHPRTLTHPVPATLISSCQWHHSIMRDPFTSSTVRTVELSMCCPAPRDPMVINARSVEDSFDCPIVNHAREILQSSYGGSERFSVFSSSVYNSIVIRMDTTILWSECFVLYISCLFGVQRVQRRKTVTCILFDVSIFFTCVVGFSQTRFRWSAECGACLSVFCASARWTKKNILRLAKSSSCVSLPVKPSSI